MKTGHKVALAAGGLGLVAAVFLFSGDAGASTRPAWTEPLDLPSTDEEWTKVKTSICTCGRGGAQGRELLVCVLDKVYEGVPWTAILDSKGLQDGDHPSLLAVIEAIGTLVLEYEQLPNEAAREAWCPKPFSPNPAVFDPPAPGPVLPGVFDPPAPAGPVFPPPPTPFEVRKKRLNELLSDLPVGGALWLPKYQMYPNNPSDTARAMLSNAGITDPKNSLVAALVGKLSCPAWNRKYAKINAEAPSYAICNGWYIGPAYLPRNADARASILEGKLPPRTIKDNGSKMSGVNASSFGMLWLPNFDVDSAMEGSLVITEPEPPADFLAMLS